MGVGLDLPRNKIAELKTLWIVRNFKLFDIQLIWQCQLYSEIGSPPTSLGYPLRGGGHHTPEVFPPKLLSSFPPPACPLFKKNSDLRSFYDDKIEYNSLLL